MKELRYFAVMFDLLTALLDSWTLWANITGDNDTAMKWRLKYLKLTYQLGVYRPYEEIVTLAAKETVLPRSYTDKLVKNWTELKPWIEVKEVLTELKKHLPLAVVTNCSQVLGQQAADLCGVKFDVVVTSERAGFYKPNPAPYTLALQDVYWHNRIGMVKPEEIPEPIIMTTSLMPLKEFIWTS